MSRSGGPEAVRRAAGAPSRRRREGRFSALSRELKDLARKANQWTPGSVQPVALHEAVSIVSFLHGGRRGLREAFERDWVTLRDSEHARDVRDRLEGHRFVGALVPVDPF